VDSAVEVAEGEDSAVLAAVVLVAVVVLVAAAPGAVGDDSEVF
jgi:hypothetical protein